MKVFYIKKIKNHLRGENRFFIYTYKKKDMGKRYEEKEDVFLKQNFSSKGLNWCSVKLNRTPYSIKNRAKILKLKFNRKGSSRIFSDEEVNFIKNNYSKLGSEEISKILDRNKEQIFRKATKLNLQLDLNVICNIHKKSTQNYWDNNDKAYERYNINPEKFMNINNPEISYILGFLWADGHIQNNGKGKVNCIELTIIKDDMNDIKWIFDKIGKWNYYNINRPKRKPQAILTTQNRPAVEFLVENDYDKKSLVSADKILNKIPDELKHYFLLGFFDGDGCIYASKKWGYNISFTGSYDQNWRWLEIILNSMNIKYSLSRKITKTGNSSVIRINKINDIEKLYNYMYRYEKDKIGLYRKYLKIKNLLNYY